MSKKLNVQRKKKDCLKIHVALITKTKEILALEVINMKVHDGKMLTKLVNHVLKTIPVVVDGKKNKKVKKIESVLAD